MPRTTALRLLGSRFLKEISGANESSVGGARKLAISLAISLGPVFLKLGSLERISWSPRGATRLLGSRFRNEASGRSV